MFTLLLRILGAFTLLGFTMYFINYYPTHIVGDYEFVRLFLLVVGGLCLMGTEVSILYFAGQLSKTNQSESIKPLYFRILSLILSVSILPLLLYFFIPNQWIIDVFGGSHTPEIIFKCLLFLPFNVLTIFNTEMIRAMHHIVWSELFRNVFKFFPIFFGVLLLSNAESQQVVLDYYIIGFVVLGIVTSLYIWNYIKNMQPTANVYSTSEILKISTPIAISNLIFYLLATIDVVLLRKWWGSDMVGLYSLPVKLILFINMITLSINVNVSPKISELYSNKNEEMQQLLKKNARIIAVINWFCGCVVIALADWILSIFGSEYVQGIHTFYILIAGHLICSLFGCVSVYLNMTNRTAVFRTIMFCSLIINLVASVLLIPNFGMMGAAISFVLANFFWYVVAAVYTYKKDKIKIFVH